MTAGKMRRGLCGVIGAALVLAGGIAFGQAGPGPKGPRPVGVVTMAQQEVPRIFTLPGRAVAHQEAEDRKSVV